MKNHIFIFISLFTVSLSMNAQVKDDHPLVNDGQPATGSPVEKRSVPAYQETRIPLKRAEVPAPLENTLNNIKYTGWEDGKLYQDPATGNYSLEMDSSRHYVFDRKGKAVDPGRINDQPVPDEGSTGAPDSDTDLNSTLNESSMDNSPVDNTTIDDNRVDENTLDD